MLCCGAVETGQPATAQHCSAIPDRMGSGSETGEGDRSGEDHDTGGEIAEEDDSCQTNQTVDTTAFMESDRVVLKTESSEENQKSEKATNFFEGVEKLLEVWFTDCGGETGDSDLRKIPR